MKSVWQITRSLRVPAFTRAGQRTRKGTRCPPSQMSALEPRDSALAKWPCASSFAVPAIGEPPLSLVKMTSVFSARPALSRAASTSPTAASVCMTKSPYAPSPLLPFHSGVGTMGVCGEVSGR